MGGASRVGHWESGNTPGYVRAQRGRARSELFSRVYLKSIWVFHMETVTYEIYVKQEAPGQLCLP